MDRIDLHTHSNVSDGTFSPRLLLKEAKKVNLTTLAITDHDTLGGLDEGKETAFKLGIEFVPGVEITTKFEERRIEILGYYFDSQSEQLRDLLAIMKKSRANRTPRILKRLENLGMPITPESLQLRPNETLSAVGRPRIARAMVNKKYVKDMQQAFDNFIGEGKPANALMFLPAVDETIKAIKSAGGIPVIPHPLGLWNKDLETLANAIESLKASGLQGIEVYYAYSAHYKGLRTIPREFVESGVSFLEELANNEDLAITGGSDFHGDEGQPGTVKIPDGTMKKFRSYAETVLGRIL